MKNISLFFLSFITAILCSDDFPLENSVIVLTNNTFDKAIKKYEKLLILFYTPSCTHCKKFLPEYENAAKIFRKENLFLVKVDVEAEKDLGEKYNIKSLPTLKLFSKSKPIDYGGYRNEKSVINWMHKINNPLLIELKTFEEVEKFKKENEICVIYLIGNETNKIKEYVTTAQKIEYLLFGVIRSEEIIKKYGKKGSIILFKPFDEKKNEYNGDIKEKNLIEFINKYSSPKFMKFDENVYEKIFLTGLPSIMILTEENSPKYSEYEKLLKTLSEKINDKLKVLIFNIKDEMSSYFAEFIGIKENELPLVRIFEIKNNGLQQYNMQYEINLENILKFINDWENKKVKRYLKSGEEPKENNRDVFIVVSKTFEKEVINNDKDVLLLFYDPSCEECKEFYLKYEEVAKKLKVKNNKLLIAKIDGNENEIESVNIDDYFVIKFYPGNKKDKEPINFDGEKTVDGIINFLKKYVHNKLVIDEDKTKDL